MNYTIKISLDSKCTWDDYLEWLDYNIGGSSEFWDWYIYRRVLYILFKNEIDMVHFILSNNI